jgi:predicted DNA-binding transcriptional regulator AlpA
MLPELDVAAIPADQLLATLAQLAAWQSQLAARLMTPAPAPEAVADGSDRLLTTVEAAAILRRSVKWIYRHQKTLPFARRLSARSWVFSERGLQKWLARQRA